MFRRSFYVGMTGFEPAATRPPDAYSNRAELHPAVPFQKSVAKIMQFFGYCKQKSLFPEINILMSNVHKVAVYVEGSFHSLGIADTVDVNVAGST